MHRIAHHLASCVYKDMASFAVITSWQSAHEPSPRVAGSGRSTGRRGGFNREALPMHQGSRLHEPQSTDRPPLMRQSHVVYLSFVPADGGGEAFSPLSACNVVGPPVDPS